MKRHSLLLSLALALMVCMAPAFAAGGQHQLTAKEYNTLSRAQKFIKEKNDRMARQTLRDFLNVVKFKPYPKALASAMLASTYLSNQEYAKAIPWLKQAIDSHGLPASQQRDNEYNLAIAYAQAKQSDKAAEVLNQLIPKYKKPNAEILLLAATENFQAGKLSTARRYALESIKVQGSHPSKTPYQILLNLQIKAKNYPEALKTTHAMMKIWPHDNSLIDTLASLQLMSKQYTQALATYKLGLKTGAIRGEASHENYVKLLILYGNPKTGLDVLARYIKERRIPDSQENKLLRVNAWTKIKNAKPEQMLPAVAAAAPGAKNGQLFLYAASLCQRMKNWHCAVKYTQAAVKKGGLSEEGGDAYLLLGTGLHELGKNKEALAAFKRAAHYKTTKKNADTWIKYLGYQLQFSQPPTPTHPPVHRAKIKAPKVKAPVKPPVVNTKAKGKAIH